MDIDENNETVEEGAASNVQRNGAYERGGQGPAQSPDGSIEMLDETEQDEFQAQ